MTGETSLKLNLGCGFRKKEGYINVDIEEGCTPDLKFDLSNGPWPWETNSVREVTFEFSMDQMGQTNEDLKCVIKELYRVMQPEGKVFIAGFHPRHDQFFLNPLCVHRLAPEFFMLLSMQNNLSQIANGLSDNCLGLSWMVNFEVLGHRYLVSREFQQEIESGQLTEPQIREKIAYNTNVCHAYEVELLIIK